MKSCLRQNACDLIWTFRHLPDKLNNTLTVLKETKKVFQGVACENCHCALKYHLPEHGKWDCGGIESTGNATRPALSVDPWPPCVLCQQRAQPEERVMSTVAIWTSLLSILMIRRSSPRYILHGETHILSYSTILKSLFAINDLRKGENLRQTNHNTDVLCSLLIIHTFVLMILKHILFH